MKYSTNQFDAKIKHQKYSHYLLPIACEPLKYGKLIEQFGNKYIIQLNTSNILVIKVVENDNYIRLFRKGDLVLEFIDSKVNETIFTRTISDQRFTFENNKLITTEILGVHNAIKIYEDITPLNYTDSNITNSKTFTTKILNWFENTYIYKNKKAELFILFELFLIFLVYITCFVIFPENNMALAVFSSKNIIKLRKVASKQNWNNLIIKIDNKVFTRNLLENSLNKLWEKTKDDFSENNHMFILFKIKYINGEFSSIGKVQRLNKNDKTWYIDFIIETMKFKSEYYNETQISSFMISYGFKEGLLKNKENISTNVNFIELNKMKLPISTKPSDYGKIIKIIDKNIFVIQNIKGQIIFYYKFVGYNEIEYFKDNKSLIKFRDVITSDNSFTRTFDNKNFYFKNNQQVLFTKKIKSKFISKTKTSKNIINNFITLDIETFINENSLYPYLISFYDGKNSYSFGLWDYKNVEEMMLDCLSSIFIRKYNGYKIYVHNLAKFDIIFLLKYIIKLGFLQPVIHNDKIISLQVNYGKNKEYQVEFKDSLLILTTSLAKLCKAFNVENSKSIFPHFFVNENNLNYIGKVPSLNYFPDIELKDFDKYKNEYNNNWNLKNEAVKYCELDCISLYQVIFKFNEMIFNLFSLNIHKYPTLPSLAFGIFRSKFLIENTIPQLSGKIASDIRSGYTGGAVDVYIPKSKPNIKMKCLDVNSLYPSQMQERLMPVGNPTYFNGNIRLIDPNAFGFFYCEVIAPDNIKHPILQTHVKTNKGIRTIAPIGTWEDMLFSEEMDNAIKYGYQFKILWGYTFESSNIFKEYVDFLFEFRQRYPSSHPLNFIAKILLNSLYGRFGMDDDFPEISVIHKDYFADFENKYLDDIIDKIKIDNYFIVFYKTENTFEDINTHNVSISIAATITAYSRIHMSQFKNEFIIFHVHIVSLFFIWNWFQRFFWMKIWFLWS